MSTVLIVIIVVVVLIVVALLVAAANRRKQTHQIAEAQVEAKHDVTLRPFRPALHRVVGEEVRHGAKADEKRREQRRCRFQPGEMKHGSRPFRYT